MAELALPLVVRIERAEPPQRTDALEAAAQAVLLMLTATEPDWQDALRAWDGQRIRKVVRRARGADWRRAESLPGITVLARTAQVRVFPPVPVDDWPPELARLQVGGTELDDPAAPGNPAAGIPLLLLAPQPEMSAGKAMAQAGHAAQLGWRASAPSARGAWQSAGFPLAVRTATPAQWASAVRSGVPVVQDGGFTEVPPGTRTAAAVLPWLPVYLAPREGRSRGAQVSRES
jgi:peptidyl-tRNA hydrolase